jgi:Bacterial regulatory proteins, luxR family
MLRSSPWQPSTTAADLTELSPGRPPIAAIGAELFISAKTVDHHVSAELAKLGAPNRNAAARAAKLGLLS